MKTFNYTITDEQGIHARPAGVLAKQAASYASTVMIQTGDKSVDAKRLLALMSLGIKCGQEITVTVEGDDEDVAATEMEAFFKENL